MLGSWVRRFLGIFFGGRLRNYTPAKSGETSNGGPSFIRRVNSRNSRHCGAPREAKDHSDQRGSITIHWILPFLFWLFVPPKKRRADNQSQARLITWNDAAPLALAGHASDFELGLTYAPSISARKLTRLLRRAPVKSKMSADVADNDGYYPIKLSKCDASHNGGVERTRGYSFEGSKFRVG